ncbi:DNA repair protein RecN [Pseudaquidulcibacter saccharophilus]|uniref:DNA repair protein RecN n=1 Tax=Pseudaquidulcibacter saccharophilus TaxID=2831900 RepID=UPI001EFF2D93|nr:DNA repair protein RecN [Pseudaquidulcibacter saccharophilus]
MLREISIRDVVLIDVLDLEIGSGFTALTGETGAGKSILLDGLGLALGERAEKGLVRAGADKSIISAEFSISSNHTINEILHEADVEVDGEVILRRTLNTDGKSKAFINDVPVSAALLKRVGNALLEVHGQHSAIGLMDESKHLEMLDAFLSHELGDDFTQTLSAVSGAYKTFETARQNLKTAQDRMGQSGAEREYLAHILKELNDLNPQIGEEEELDTTRRFLMGSERITETIKEAVEAIEGGKVENYLGVASRAMSKIGAIEGENGKKLNSLVEAAVNSLENAQNNIADALGNLQSLGYSIDLDPKELERIEERLFAIRGAARKHGVIANDLPRKRDEIAEKLSLIDNCDEELLKAEKAFKIAKEEYDNLALSLSQKRQSGAKIFDEKVMGELPPLKLEKMRFNTSFESDATRIAAKGIDKVRFEIAPNPGAGFGPLSQIASGGELSRLSLALKVILSATSGTLALVFDEVDQGIGGATADAVGKRLKELAKNAQVLCVTHSPQVAARANHHLRIEKRVENGITRTTVVRLSDKERVEEVARMLAGEIITDEARKAAKSLMENQ